MSNLSQNDLPNEVTLCHQMILQLQEQMQCMQGQIEILLRGKYGSKVEKVNLEQLRLFEDVGKVNSEETKETKELSIEVKAHGRKRISKELHRERRVYDVSEDHLACPGCNQERQIIGEEISSQLDYSPASIKVIEHVRIKRACKQCAEHVVIAEKPKSVIGKGLATAGMLAHVATSKYADHLPLNRMEGIFKREGVRVSRSTMCDWMAATARCLLPVYERMKQLVRSSKIIWTDDTPVAMQDRDHERNIRKARVWVYIGDENNPLTVFDFTNSRRRDGPVLFLKDFTGFLQADAFSGYDCIYAGGKVREIACWAHARRKFFESLKTNSSLAAAALKMIGELYKIEKLVRENSASSRQEVRATESKPVLQLFKAWLDQHKLVAMPKSPLGKAITYSLNNWDALNRYVENGALTIDNNKSERALRATAVGRKNWLFIGSMDGGRTAAIITSIMASCKAHNVNPREYLKDVLSRLADGETEIDSLLPHKWKPCT